jgi:chorismate mutase
VVDSFGLGTGPVNRPAAHRLTRLRPCAIHGTTPTHSAIEVRSMTTTNPTERTDHIVDDLRRQIDRFDAEIVRLVNERAKVSELVQQVRLRAGGTRIELHREAAIIRHYRKELGKEGSALGEAVLRICRGAMGGVSR